MTTLPRTRPASTQLLLRILDRPELVAAVRELPAPVLGRLIERVGLEDAGELVALASSEQLLGVFDQDLWRAAAPGEDEAFLTSRFALWLEIMSEGGEDFLIEQLCALPRDLLTLAVHRLVLVVGMDALSERFLEPSAEQQRLERALDAALFEEWEEFRLVARDPMHWDALWGALLALDRDHHDLVRAVLERCCALSTEYVEEQGGLYDVLSSEAMLEGDVAGEREDRREAEGFVAPADARAFLELARRGERLEARDPVTAAYFRSRAIAKPARAAERAVSGSDTSSGDVSRLVHLLEEVAGGEPLRPQALPSLAAGPAAAKARGQRTRPEPAPLPAPQPSALLLQAAMTELGERNPELFSRRVEELGYLANVLVAGSRDRRPRPVEALEQAVAVCNRGLERVLGADVSVERAVELLEATPADLLFRRGYE